MIGLLQRVSRAAVRIDDEVIGQIGRGILVFVAVHRDDNDNDIERLATRLITYRVFPDDEGRMNHSVRDICAEMLLVPQFTLAADTKKGSRASFTKGADPAKASSYFDALVTCCRRQLEIVEAGRFGADMQVELVNDGPVTFLLES